MIQPSSEEELNLSVIIPVRNGKRTLKQCLSSIERSSFTPLEVIVVDDCSPEDCSDVVRPYGFKVIRLDKSHDAEHARNKGAEQAKGDILVFTDCDMVIQPDALQRIYQRFSEDHYGAVSGVCSPEPNDKKFATRYKHLWMYYSYVNSPEDFDFWISSIGAVKREVFFELKGFRTTFQTKYGGGDLEFGRRLKQAGQKILLDTKIQGEHLKRYTLLSLLQNDYNRGKGWFEFAVGQGIIPYVIRKMRIANVYPVFLISVVISILFLSALLLSPFSKLFFILGTLSFIVYFIINYTQFQFFHQQAGTGFLWKAIPLSFLDHLVAGLGVLRGCIGYIGAWINKRFTKSEENKV